MSYMVCHECDLISSPFGTDFGVNIFFQWELTRDFGLHGPFPVAKHVTVKTDQPWNFKTSKCKNVVFALNWCIHDDVWAWKHIPLQSEPRNPSSFRRRVSAFVVSSGIIVEQNNRWFISLILIGCGFSDRFPDILQYVGVPILDTDECRQSYVDGSYTYNEITDNMFCAGFYEGGKDTCQASDIKCFGSGNGAKQAPEIYLICMQ